MARGVAKSIVLMIGLLSAASRCQAAEPELARFDFSEGHMGTQFVVTLYAPSKEHAERAAAAALKRVGELDRRLSDYQPQSELSRLSRSAGGGKSVRVSEDLWRVLARAEEISRWSGGAFDVTVGPYVRLWRRARRTGQMPSDERLIQARQAVGHLHVQLSESGREVELTREGMRLDLGAIAKGYAADEALAAAQAQGVRAAMIDAGGDLAIGDAPPGEPGWRVAIAPLGKRSPGTEGRGGDADGIVLLLANCGVATSGEAYQYVEFAGKRYSHVVDPRTGIGVTIPSSITVVAPDCTTADALASALSVLGPVGLERLNEFPDTAALIVRVEDGEERRYVSPGMAQHFLE